MRYHGNHICPDKWTDGEPENIMPLSTLSGGEGIKINPRLPITRLSAVKKEGKVEDTYSSD